MKKKLHKLAVQKEAKWALSYGEGHSKIGPPKYLKLLKKKFFLVFWGLFLLHFSFYEGNVNPNFDFGFDIIVIIIY